MKNRWFSSSPSALLGLDIGSAAVKALLLHPAETGFSVHGYAIEYLPENTLRNREILNFDALSAAIKNIKRKLTVNKTPIAAAVSGSHVITKVVQVEAQLNEFELEEQILLEVDSLLPFPLEDIYLDFETLGVSQTHHGKDDVLLTAAHRELVDLRCTLLREHKLEPAVMDVESHALVNAFLACTLSQPDTLDICLHIGYETMLVCATSDGMLNYHKEHSFGCGQLLQDLQANSNMLQPQLVQALSEGTLEQTHLERSYPLFLQQCVQHIHRALQIMQSSTSDYASRRLFISGGICLLPNIAGDLSNELNEPITEFNPLPTLDPEQPQLGSQFTIAYGLSMRSTNPCHR
jgi:type IV pilus assembly protein PilM